MSLTACSNNALEEAKELIPETPVTVTCSTNHIRYGKDGYIDESVYEDYIFTGYPENLEITDTSEDGVITAQAVIKNDYYYTAEPIEITYRYDTAENRTYIYSADTEENTVEIQPTIEFDTNMFFALEIPLVMTYEGNEIPITRDYIASIELVTDNVCRYSASYTSVEISGEVHFTTYEGDTYCNTLHIWFPPINGWQAGGSVNANEYPDYDKEPVWEIEWGTSPSALLVKED